MFLCHIFYHQKTTAATHYGELLIKHKSKSQKLSHFEFHMLCLLVVNVNFKHWALRFQLSQWRMLKRFGNRNIVCQIYDPYGNGTIWTMSLCWIGSLSVPHFSDSLSKAGRKHLEHGNCCPTKSYFLFLSFCWIKMFFHSINTNAISPVKNNVILPAMPIAINSLKGFSHKDEVNLECNMQSSVKEKIFCSYF